jgi:hypothetical protein
MTSGDFWYEDYLGHERFEKFFVAAEKNRTTTIALVEWDREMRGELQKVLGEWEIAMRNAYDLTMRSWWEGEKHWLLDPKSPVQRPIWHRYEDINEGSRLTISKAVKRAGPKAPIGKVIANLSLDFWRYLTTKRREKSLWVPALHRTYPRGMNRGYIDHRIDLLYRLRNQIAHNEPVFHRPIRQHTATLIHTCELIVPPLADAIFERASIATLWAKCPINLP